MSIQQLRDGSVTRDPRLDNLPEYDVRSRRYGIKQTGFYEEIKTLPPINKLWECTQYFDQGREGKCVGYACAHERSAEPIPIPSSVAEANLFYAEAQKDDQWEGEDYEGTSTLGAAKALKRLGKIEEYRWCFGVNELIMTLSYKGPVVLGIPWTEGMNNPSVDGLIQPTGQILGWHAILAKGVHVDYQYIVLHNSWGQTWGDYGDCYIAINDAQYLLMMGGTVCLLLDKAA